jgi:hypothetical protein
MSMSCPAVLKATQSGVSCHVSNVRTAVVEVIALTCRATCHCVAIVWVLTDACNYCVVLSGAIVLRDFAAYRESQGGAANLADAARLRKMAAGLASDTMDKMYQAEDGLGWFNVVFPGKASSDPLTVMQMRHVVDFFSVTFGCKFPSSSVALLQYLLGCAIFHAIYVY